MSLFFLYFELKNTNSKNYQGFNEVGKFYIPDLICAGRITVLFENKLYEAGIISDESKQCSNNFFQKNNDNIKNILIDFISLRLKNSCVKAYLVGFIYTNQNLIQVVQKGSVVSVEELRRNFNINMFPFNSCIEIIN